MESLSESETESESDEVAKIDDVEKDISELSIDDIKKRLPPGLVESDVPPIPLSLNKMTFKVVFQSHPVSPTLNKANID